MAPVLILGSGPVAAPQGGEVRLYPSDPVRASAASVGAPGPDHGPAGPKGERDCSTCSTWYKRRRRPSRFNLRHGPNFWSRLEPFGGRVEGACPELLLLSASRKLSRFGPQLRPRDFTLGSPCRTEFWPDRGFSRLQACALPSRILCYEHVPLGTTVWPPGAPESLSTNANSREYLPGRTLENPTAGKMTHPVEDTVPDPLPKIPTKSRFPFGRYRRRKVPPVRGPPGPEFSTWTRLFRTPGRGRLPPALVKSILIYMQCSAPTRTPNATGGLRTG